LNFRNRFKHVIRRRVNRTNRMRINPHNMSLIGRQAETICNSPYHDFIDCLFNNGVRHRIINHLEYFYIISEHNTRYVKILDAWGKVTV
uniref:Polyprotein n=1 Tax=Haemonchus placei TaxID=6290 RepID=A0A0N4VSZ2_HAEPC